MEENKKTWIDDLKEEIDTNIKPNNHKREITGANLNTTLKEMVDKLSEHTPTSLGELKEDSTHRTVTDEEKQTWGKIAAIFDEQQQYTDDERLQALANVSNQEAGYESEVFTGKMGYVVLQPKDDEDSEHTTFAAQVTEANTIYEIRDVFDLGGNTVTLPDNCVLKFNGGKIKSGSLSGNCSLVIGSCKNIFDGVRLTGTWKNAECELSWWGCVPYDSNDEVDNSNNITLALNSAIRKIVVRGIYGISSPVNILLGTHIVEGGSIGGFKQDGFVANSDFVGKDFTHVHSVETYNLHTDGMVYYMYDQSGEINNLFFDAKKVANYCIEHVAGYSGPYMKNVRCENALVANIVQSASEHLIWNHVYSNNSNVGFYVSNYKINPADVLSYGSLIGQTNMMNMQDCRAINCNYGFLVFGGSNYLMQSCQSSLCSIVGLYAAYTFIDLVNYYSERDANCNFYIDAYGVRQTPTEANHSLPYLVSNNMDGLPTYSTQNQYAAQLYLRAPIWEKEATLNFENLFTSVNPRSYDAIGSATTIEAPTVRNAQGVDGYIIGVSGAVNINEHKKFIHSSDATPEPTYCYITVKQRADGLTTSWVCNSLNYRRRNEVNYLDNPAAKVLDYRFNVPIVSGYDLDLNNVHDLYRSGSGVNTPWENFARIKGYYDGVPLYEVSQSFAPGNYFEMKRLRKNFNGVNEIMQRFGDLKEVLVRWVIYVNEALTAKRISIGSTFYKNSPATSTPNGESDTTSPNWPIGYYELYFRMNLVNYGIEYDQLFFMLWLPTDIRDKVFVSEPLFYRVGSKITPPTKVLNNSGTTSLRPIIANTGQQYYDESLGKFICHNGTTWVNLDGTALS